MMLFHTGKLRFLAVATTMLASMSFISAASAAGPTYALVQINQQALFFNLMNKGAQDAAKASGEDLVIFNSKSLEYILYHFGVNHTKMVIKNGKIVYSF